MPHEYADRVHSHTAAAAAAAAAVAATTLYATTTHNQPLGHPVTSLHVHTDAYHPRSLFIINTAQPPCLGKSVPEMPTSDDEKV